MRKTKIICTIGPASESEEKLRELINAGMNVARFNFSHGTYPEHEAKFKRLVRLRKEMGVPVAALLDTKGPEIRLRDFENGKITLSSAVRGDTAEITVQDDGIGVAPEDREKIFDRFFTADRAHTAGKGTGLGLSICKRIMDMHSQSLRLLDTESGAAFRFTLEHAEAPEGDLTEPGNHA